MSNPITTALENARLDYVLYQKALSLPAQAGKLDKLRKKKPQRCFVITRKPKTESYVTRYTSDPHIDVLIVRGTQVCLINSLSDPKEIEEEIIDVVVNCGEIYICEECHDEIKTHKLKCVSKDCEACLCTFCFVQTVLAQKEPCPACGSNFIDSAALSYLDELVELYKSNPRDMMTLMKKKKKMLPPGLKNIDKIFQSAMSESKTRGVKFPLEVPS